MIILLYLIRHYITYQSCFVFGGGWPGFEIRSADQLSLLDFSDFLQYLQQNTGSRILPISSLNIIFPFIVI